MSTKCVSASGYTVSCQAGNLEAEISRLTRELDEAKKENHRQSTGSQLLAKQLGELELRFAWHKVSDGLPTEAGRYVLRGFDGMWEVLTNWPVDSDLAWSIHALWLGPLPAAPHEAEHKE